MSKLKRKVKTVLEQSQKKYMKALYGSCVVLLYHRVASPDTDPQLLSVTPENFNAQLNYLKNNFKVLTIDEFQFYLDKKIKFPKNAVLITFDDGYADNYYEALPVLEKLKLQALFYISTGTIDTSKEFWWDAVERILLLRENKPLSENILINGVSFSLANLNDKQQFGLYNTLLPVLRNMPGGLRDDYINQLADIFNSHIDRDSHRALKSEELIRLQQSPFAIIGAHTHLHPSLGALTYEEQFLEIEQSKLILSDVLNREITHFSYPFGTINDFNENTFLIVKKLGFKLVAANIPKTVNMKTNPFSYPRFLVRNWEQEEFSVHINSFFN
jgi:peptidoglycan/xylan/chitin deacetylase (PgdA/CDA1 family)